MTPDTLNFDYGNAVTALGLIGLGVTAVVLFLVFRDYTKSPYNK